MSDRREVVRRHNAKVRARNRLPYPQVPRAIVLTPLGYAVTGVPKELLDAGYTVVGVAEVWP